MKTLPILLDLIYDSLVTKDKNRLVSSIINRDLNLLARRPLDITRLLLSLPSISPLLTLNKRLLTSIFIILIAISY